MPPRIDSPKNQTIKNLARLKERRHRDASQRYLVEGTREVTRALSAGVPLEEIFVCPEILRPEGRALVGTLTLPQTEVSPEAFKRLSLRQNPDGILGVARMQETSLETLVLPNDALVLVVDGLEKPGNLGALLRTADAGDLGAVFVTGAGTDLYNPNTIRSSLGSVFSRPVVAVETGELLKFLLAAGFKLVAATPDAARTYWAEDYRGGVAIVLGTEHAGLGPDWRGAASAEVSIPMHGLADSLNVSVAGALLVYEALRQRRELPDSSAGF